MKFSILAALMLASAAAAADPAWLAEFDRLMTAGNAQGAQQYLAARPIVDQKTADYMWARARVHRALNQPEPAAIDVITYDNLTRRKGRDLSDLRAWLFAEAKLFLSRADDLYRRGDRAGAVRAYLHAALCDTSILRRADGLREDTGRTLAKIVHDHPERSDYWILLAGYHYHLDHIDAARAAMQHYLKQDLDEFHRWRGEVMLSSVERGLEKHRQLADKLMRDAEAEAQANAAKGPAQPDPGPLPEAKPKEPSMDEKLSRHRRLLDLDARIRDMENRIAELRQQRKGQVVVGSHGHVYVEAHNQRQVKADLESAEKQLADLKYERDSL
jgi:hypothetical protein